MELLAHLAAGASIALSWSAIFYCIIGVTLGMVMGVLPGIGPLPAIAMLLPLTFYIAAFAPVLARFALECGEAEYSSPAAVAAMGESGSTSTRCTGLPRTATASRSGRASSSSPKACSSRRGSRCR